MKQGISPALDFVLSSCFRNPAELTTPHADWRDITRIILGNRILGHMIDRLDSTTSASDQVPNELTHAYRNQTMEALLSAGEIVKVSKLASSSQTPIYFYKGPVWSQWLFDDVKKRAPGDIDVFVPRENLIGFIELLRNNGYTIYPYHEMLLNSPSSLRKAFLNSDYHIPLYNYDASGKTKAVVEVHWTIAYPRLSFDFQPENFTPYATSLSFLNHDIPTLINEYQLLMLIVNHGGKEGWNRLKYIVDLKGYLDRYSTSTDWDLVYRIAREKGITRLLNDGLGIVKALGYKLDSVLPDIKPFPGIGALSIAWDELAPLPKNATWSYFKHAMTTRDPSHRLKILQKHLSFLSDFSLHRRKLQWYNSVDDRRSV